MTTGTLTTQIRIGNSKYPTGTKILKGETIDPGTWDERVWVTFPNGEGTFLLPSCVK